MGRFACDPTDIAASMLATIVSMNAFYDPHVHMKIGSALRPLREDGYLLIGTGGAVHNLYRNHWEPMVLYRDNFAQLHPPEKPMLEFRQSVEDCFTQNRGPALRRAITRLMKHPDFRNAHVRMLSSSLTYFRL